MSERIKELIKQSTHIQGPTPYNPLSFEVFDKEKFAELIVRECADTLQVEMYRLDAIPGREVSAQTMETAQVLIKKHFGID